MPRAGHPTFDSGDASQEAFTLAGETLPACLPCEQQILSIDSNSAAFSPLMVDFPMSRLSRLLLSRSKIAAIAARRRLHYLFLQKHFSNTAGLRPLFPNLPGAVCPWVFPIVFEGIRNAHKPLRQMGIPAVTWGGVRHPAIPKDHFPGANFLYDSLVFLPVHQGLRERDLDLIARAVKEVRKQRQSL